MLACYKEGILLGIILTFFTLALIIFFGDTIEEWFKRIQNVLK